MGCIVWRTGCPEHKGKGSPVTMHQLPTDEFCERLDRKGLTVLPDYIDLITEERLKVM